MGSKKKPSIEVPKYYLGLHIGFCHGPVDAFKEIYIDKKLAWEGSVGTEIEVVVDKQELFGGIRKEGGVFGSVMFLPGKITQLLPEGLAKRLGRTTATTPGFRRIASLWFSDGVDNNEGFYWRANQPSIPPVAATVTVIPKELGAGNSIINGDQANPAHMIYECLTNTDWGMGTPSFNVDVGGFQNVAQTLFDEQFGLSMIWAQQTDVQSFIEEILDHIQATLFLNPRTGLLTLRLIRDDYDTVFIPTYTPRNARVTKFQRKGWGETVNEIVVTWTNPETEQEESISLQDLANVTIQGAIVSQTRNYYGVRNAELANQLCVRDLRSSSSPLASVEMVVNREAWYLIPGDTFKLEYPEYGIETLICRVTNIDYGKPGQPEIKVTAVEDVFALPISSFTNPPVTEWEDTSEEPSPIDNVRIITAPYYFLANLIPDADLNSLQYPEAFSMILASENGQDTFSYDLLGEDSDATGTPELVSLGQRNPVGRSLLPSSLAAEATTIIPDFGTVLGGPGPQIGAFAMVDRGSELEDEVMLIVGNSGSGWEVQRGVLDTVPRDHVAGSPVFFFDSDSSIFDNSVQSAFQTVEYKLLANTSLGTLDETLAPINSTNLTDRNYLPFRPGNFKVEGQGFGLVSLASTVLDFTVSWENRNRLTEDSVVVPWEGGDMSPESGQTTKIEVLDSSDNIVVSYNSLPGNSHTIPVADLNGETEFKVRAKSEVGGLFSLQGHEIEVEIV